MHPVHSLWGFALQCWACRRRRCVAARHEGRSYTYEEQNEIDELLKKDDFDELEAIFWTAHGTECAQQRDCCVTRWTDTHGRVTQAFGASGFSTQHPWKPNRGVWMGNIAASKHLAYYKQSWIVVKRIMMKIAPKWARR